MRLATVVDQIAMECDLAKSTIGQYRKAASRFSEWLGKPAEADDLTREQLNCFIVNLQQVVQNTTAGNYRRALCRLWNYLTAVEDKPAYEIKRLRRPRNEERPVVAWSMSDVISLLQSCEQLTGRLRIGVAPKDYFTAWIWVAFDTGLRPSCMFELEWTQIDWHRKSIPLTQHKTRKPHCVFLSDESIAALKSIQLPSRKTVFPLSWGGMRRYTSKIFAEAAVGGFHRLEGQNLGTLRKTHATEVYVDLGEAAAAESLGQVSGTRIVKKHYIDHRATRKYSIPRRPNVKRE